MKLQTTDLFVNALDSYLYNKYNIRLGLNTRLVFALQFVVVCINNHKYNITYNDLIKYYVENNRTNQ